MSWQRESKKTRPTIVAPLVILSHEYRAPRTSVPRYPPLRRKLGAHHLRALPNPLRSKSETGCTSHCHLRINTQEYDRLLAFRLHRRDARPLDATTKTSVNVEPPPAIRAKSLAVRLAMAYERRVRNQRIFRAPTVTVRGIEPGTRSTCKPQKFFS